MILWGVAGQAWCPHPQGKFIVRMQRLGRRIDCVLDDEILYNLVEHLTMATSMGKPVREVL